MKRLEEPDDGTKRNEKGQVSTNSTQAVPLIHILSKSEKMRYVLGRRRTTYTFQGVCSWIRCLRKDGHTYRNVVDICME